MIKTNQRAQQEIVGFVLIVVLVMVGLMVFLVISVKNTDSERDSLEASNMLASIMKATTECAIVFEPDYDDFEDLFKSCHEGRTCSNLNKKACDYLSESLEDLLNQLQKSEAALEAYQLKFFEKSGDGIQGIFEIESGNCTSKVIAAQRAIVSGSDSLIIQLKLCK